MWELDCEESWAPKNWRFWTVVLEKTLESPLDCKEIQPVHSKGDQSWVFIGRTNAEAETPVLWPPDVKSWLTGKDPDARRGWGQEEKGTIEDEMAGGHHRLDAHEFGWTPGVGDGQGGLAFCSSWGHKESDTTERLNWTTCWFHQSSPPDFWTPYSVIFICLSMLLQILYCLFYCKFIQSWSSLVAQTVKNLLAMWETLVQSLGWEDPPAKGMAIHFSILVWRIPWTVKPVRATVYRVAKSCTWLSN